MNGKIQLVEISKLVSLFKVEEANDISNLKGDHHVLCYLNIFAALAVVEKADDKDPKDPIKRYYDLLTESNR